MSDVDVSIADRRGDDLDARQIDLELLGEQHRQRGVDALSHFRAIDEDGDGVVDADLEPRVQLAADAGCAAASADRSPIAGQRQASTSPPPSCSRALQKRRAGRVIGRPASRAIADPLMRDWRPRRSNCAARWIALRMRG